MGKLGRGGYSPVIDPISVTVSIEIDRLLHTIEMHYGWFGWEKNGFVPTWIHGVRINSLAGTVLSRTHAFWGRGRRNTW